MIALFVYQSKIRVATPVFGDATKAYRFYTTYANMLLEITDNDESRMSEDDFLELVSKVQVGKYVPILTGQNILIEMHNLTPEDELHTLLYEYRYEARFTVPELALLATNIGIKMDDAAINRVWDSLRVARPKDRPARKKTAIQLNGVTIRSSKSGKDMLVLFPEDLTPHVVNTNEYRHLIYEATYVEWPQMESEITARQQNLMFQMKGKA